MKSISHTHHAEAAQLSLCLGHPTLTKMHYGDSFYIAGWVRMRMIVQALQQLILGSAYPSQPTDP